MATPKTEEERYLVRALNYVTGEQAPRIEALGAVRARHVERLQGLLNDPNIVGVGISEKVTEKKGTDTLSLCFYVEKKVSARKVSPARLVPPVVAVPDGPPLFTDVKAIGRIRPEVNAKRTPIESGFSVGHFRVTAGTVGAIVAKGRKRFVLSNSHVLANSGKGQAGDRILYPGRADGGKAADRMGILADFVPFDTSGALTNLVDVALAEVTNGAAGPPDMDFGIEGTNSPLGITTAVRGMVVTKRGRTTGVTKGKVVDVNFRVRLPYPGVGTIGFHDQVLCERYSQGGDSGSLVVDVASGRIVGLHFAGASGGSVFNPIQAVMKALKFRFIDP